MSRSRSYDAGDEAQVKDRNQKVENETAQLDADLRKLLDRPEGRRVMWWVISEAGVYRTSFTGNSTTFFNEGRRDLGLSILARISSVDNEALLSMMREQHETENH